MKLFANLTSFNILTLRITKISRVGQVHGYPLRSLIIKARLYQVIITLGYLFNKGKLKVGKIGIILMKEKRGFC